MTKLALKSVRPPIAWHAASTGAETVAVMRAHPEIGVVLLDVVMESDHAGLDACREIRAFNPLVRILLRTGQPGHAPERETIDGYDIDGYLPKAELSSSRLYSALRTALRAFDRLGELERHRRALEHVHDAVIGLHPWAPLPELLDSVLGAAASICAAPLAVLQLETFGRGGDPERIVLHVSSSDDPPEKLAVDAEEAVASVRRDRSLAATKGFLVPLALERELGEGFVYVPGATPDALAQKMLPVLMSHAANVIHAAVARRLLDDDTPLFDAIQV